MNETTLDRARAGDGDAFQELVEPHRRELLVHCYRILGSLQDAEDVLQEVLMAAWRALSRFDGRSLRAWLYRIATNRCLNFLRDETRRPQSTLVTKPISAPDGGLVSSDEPWWLDPYPDALMDDAAVSPEARYDSRESIALSFVAALQHLPVQQRAVLILRDVLGFSAAEVANILGTTTTSVNSALVRARSGLGPDRRPDLIPSRTRPSKRKSSIASSTPSKTEMSTRWSHCSPGTPRSKCHRSPLNAAEPEPSLSSASNGASGVRGSRWCRPGSTTSLRLATTSQIHTRRSRGRAA